MGIRILGKFDAATTDGFLVDDTAVKMTDGTSLRNALSDVLNYKTFTIKKGTEDTKGDWDQIRTTLYSCTIPYKSHGFANPYLDDAIGVEVETSVNGKTTNETARVIFKTFVAVNGDITLYSNSKIDCIVRIKGA